jgi:CRP/FNR family transcriptional regulator, anaerobic regulatory protein
LLRDDALELPLTQSHVADTLGLSLVHTNKTLRKLHDQGLIGWKDKLLKIHDMTGVARLARFEETDNRARPLI